MVADDRQRVDGATTNSSRVMWAAAGAVFFIGAGLASFILAREPLPSVVTTPSPSPPVSMAPAPPPVTPAPPPAPTPEPEPVDAVEPAPVATPEPVTPEPEPAKAWKPTKPRVAPEPVTNEEWLHRAFKTHRQKLLACVEQDLRERPNAPTRYMVTLTFQPDGLPVNSFTQLTPKGSHAVWDCLRMAIFHAINEEGTHNRALPQRGNFTIALPLDFTGAKPATKRMVGFGDD